MSASWISAARQFNNVRVHCVGALSAPCGARGSQTGDVVVSLWGYTCLASIWLTGKPLYSAGEIRIDCTDLSYDEQTLSLRWWISFVTMINLSRYDDLSISLPWSVNFLTITNHIRYDLIFFVTMIVLFLYRLRSPFYVTFVSVWY